MRSATLTLGAPPAMAVPMGPFSATRLRRTDSTAAWLTRLACFGGFVGARFELFPIDLHAGGFQDAPGGGRDFRPDAFSGDQSDFVSHGCIVLYAKVCMLVESAPRQGCREENCARCAVAGKGFAIL